MKRHSRELTNLKSFSVLDFRFWIPTQGPSGQFVGGGGGEGEAAMLRERVEELQLTLQREIEQHQRELTALQTLDTERTQALTKSHKRQISQLQEQLQEMERKQGGMYGGRERSSLVPRLYLQGVPSYSYSDQSA